MHPVNAGRLVVCDNFYTRHTLAKAVLAMTDDEVRLLAIVGAVVNSIARVSKNPRGSWELIAAVDSTAFSKNAKKAHDCDNPNSLHTSARHTNYRVSFPLEPVVFNSNDLTSTPSARVLGGGYSEAKSCYNGLYPIRGGLKIVDYTGNNLWLPRMWLLITL
ncbi:hypothetical protein PHMEG_00011542 [Phytophthora megakarya]|uniref:PiggyBac transposable element-derived protein domain-containing protein n=1 Tax=Phytophthora megakarya TaxID=4795 RepID=A0A225WBF8_9STRA|nr:hypothetical protein PHMEG_00011542 [Phytophthora megakarya]